MDGNAETVGGFIFRDRVTYYIEQAIENLSWGYHYSEPLCTVNSKEINSFIAVLQLGLLFQISLRHSWKYFQIVGHSTLIVELAISLTLKMFKKTLRGNGIALFPGF